MKKLVIILIIISLFSVTMVTHGNRNRGYKTRQEYYDKYLSKDSKELAGFLYHIGKLDEFIEVDKEDWQSTYEKAASLFDKNEIVHQQALKLAQDYITEQDSLTEQDIKDMVDEQFAGIYATPRSDDFETYAEYKDYMKQKYSVTSLAKTGQPVSGKATGHIDEPTD